MSGIPPSGSPFVTLISATTYRIAQLDLGNVLVFTSNSPVAVTLPGPGSGGGFARGQWVEVVAAGSGTVTITPVAQPPSITAPTINGASSLALSSSATRIYQDATGNWRTVGAPAAAGLTQLTGNVTAGPGSGSQAATIAAGAVTYANIQNVAASSLVGNPTGAPAAPEGVTLGANLSFNGTAIDAGDAPLVLTGQISTPGALIGTLGNAPATGDPQTWLQVSINGVVHFIPAWHV